MLSLSDFLRLPYTPDLTEGGVAYALRSLNYKQSSYDQIRRIVARVAIELAFRRYLSQENIPFEIESATPFTEPDKHDVLLGGRRCDLKSFLISHRSQISKMRDNPSVILNAPALIPSDHFAADGCSDHDLYLFAFLSGLTAASRLDLKKVIETNQPYYLIHTMPESWSRPFNWNPLGPLVLKSESDVEIQIEISGQDQARGFLTRLVNIPPKMRVSVNDPFYSVAAIHIKAIPSARLGIHSSTHKEAYIIPSSDWGNIWVYGMEIILTGYISRNEFRQHAKLVPPNSRVFQYDRTKTKNLAVPVSSLNSLQGLFARTREWELQK